MKINREIFISLADKLSWIDKIVGGVWFFLSLLMFFSAGKVYQQKGFGYEFWLIIALIAATWSYPLYTFGYKLIPGLIGNIVYLAFVFFVIFQLKPVSAVAAQALYPIIIWVTVATFYVIFQIMAK